MSRVYLIEKIQYERNKNIFNDIWQAKKTYALLLSFNKKNIKKCYRLKMLAKKTKYITTENITFIHCFSNHRKIKISFSKEIWNVKYSQELFSWKSDIEQNMQVSDRLMLHFQYKEYKDNSF